MLMAVADVIGALLLIIPITGLVFGVRRAATRPRTALLFSLGCVVVLVSWLVTLLNRIGAWRTDGASENLLEKAFAVVPELVLIVGPIGVAFVLVAFVLETRAAAAFADAASRPRLWLRPWSHVAAAAAAFVPMSLLVALVPVGDASPTLVRGTAVHVNDTPPTFVFLPDGVVGGIEKGSTYPLDNPMWVDSTLQKHMGGRPECLSLPGDTHRRVELALVDVHGNYDAGFGNLRLLLSVRCLG
nr:hypothetical protein [Kibdelosporangium sp. MJ126-NF4]CEL17440.1 hypothetical protein [Kibdelosporangium sp. MJ126-NF4]